MSETSKRILIIDDEPDIVLLLKSRLESHGFNVESAYSGEEGLEKIKDFNPDVILLDVIMPFMSGYTVCSHIKSDETLNRPVIMLTSRHREVDEQLGYLCKAESYIRKPHSGIKLIPEIERILGMKSDSTTSNS